jgi:hypothetical protein
MHIFSVAKRCNGRLGMLSRGLQVLIAALQYFLTICSCSQRVIPRSLAVAQGPSASPRHILDIVWLRRHSEGAKLVSFFSPVAIPLLKRKEGEGYDDILDLDVYSEIETNLVTEVSSVRHAA